jgi:uncharacterized protein (TIGR02996 family)
MTHHEGFLAAILAEPEEDAHRLVYADWLEDNGDPGRAEFIRAGVEVARTGCHDCPTPVRRAGGATHAWRTLPCGLCRFCRPMIRARKLMNGGRHTAHFPFLSEFATALNLSRDPWDCPGPWFLFRRGFVAEVTLACDQWMRHGRALVRAAPLERAGLSDRAPLLIVSDSWVWLRQGDAPEATHTLPDDLAYAMNATERRAGWDSEAAARKALSVACLKWARNPAPAIH